jgi:predicted aspartyl protease
MHFSNIPPKYAVNDLKIKNEVVSDNLGSSEIIARRIDPFPSKSRTSRVVIKGNQVLVPVRWGFNGSEIQTLLVLDTGATITTVHREVALRLNAKKTYQSNSRVADGRTISSEIAELDYIIVGPHKHTNFKVSIINYQGEKEDSTGLLGMNFIKHASYKINYKNETIEWEL